MLIKSIDLATRQSDLSRVDLGLESPLPILSTGCSHQSMCGDKEFLFSSIQIGRLTAALTVLETGLIYKKTLFIRVSVPPNWAQYFVLSKTHSLPRILERFTKFQNIFQSPPRYLLVSLLETVLPTWFFLGMDSSQMSLSKVNYIHMTLLYFRKARTLVT